MANTNTQLLEYGDIYFFYRPRVGLQQAQDIEDVQRLYLLLHPRDKKQLYRLAIVGEKRLPELQSPGSDPYRRTWAFIWKIGTNAESVEDELDREVYGTSTRGERELAPARPAGEGVYGIIEHKGAHTHLAYILELPRQPGAVQENLGLHPRASYIITVKNPEQPSPPGVGLPPREKAAYPDSLRERFGRLRFIPAKPTELLDYEGAEFVLIGASADAEGELGIELPVETEDEITAEIFRDLKVEREEHPLQPLFKGEWT